MKARISSILLLISIIGLSLHTFAQTSATGEVRGFVYDKTSGEPIIFTKVLLQGTIHGASTDVNGFFSITKIPPGSYTLLSSGIGLDTFTMSINLTAGQKITQNIYLNKSAIGLKTVDVSADKTEKVTETQVSVTKITPKQITAIPSVGGEPDLAQYLQVLPGVVFTGDQGGQLYIRGGAPIQNKVLLDGMVIYNPFHSIGLFSVFETDIIRNVDVYTGGFGAEYGGRVSAIMDVTTREGNKKRFAGKVAVNPFTSKLILEGPFSKYKEGKTSTSYIFSGRTSYLEQSSKSIYKYVDTAGLPYNFTDLYGKISINGVNGSKISFFGFNFSDEVNYQAPAALKWNSTGFGTHFVLVPASSSVLVDGTFAYSGYEIQLKEQLTKPRKSEVNGFNSGMNFTYFLGSNEFKYGIELLGFKTNFLFTNAAGNTIQQEEFTTEIATFFKYKYNHKRLILEPSIRAHYYASLSEMSIEPRLAAKYVLTENMRLKFAGGFYSQNLMSATSDRDVVNLFYGFLSGPDNLPKTFDGAEVTSALQKARHAIGGIEIDFLRHWQLNIETYIKHFNQLTNVNRDKIYNDTQENADKPDFQKKDFIIERGNATGLDFALKYEYKKIYLWATYSLAFVDRYDGVRTYNPHFDRRHNVNMVASYTFGKNNDWELDARWNLGSGFPFTQTQGYYEKINFGNNINTDYTSQNGQLGVIYGELNQGRLPYYHRLDLSMKKRWEISKTSKIEANAGITNVYNRENIFYFDRLTSSRKNQLPFLPSVGMSWSF